MGDNFGCNNLEKDWMQNRETLQSAKLPTGRQVREKTIYFYC